MSDAQDAQRRTGYLFEEQYMWHTTAVSAGGMPPEPWLQPESPMESPEGKRRIHNLFAVSGLLDHVELLRARPATRAELCRFHDADYIDSIAEASAAFGGDAGGATVFGPGSYEIAALSAGGAISACDAVVNGHVDNAYALIRPPGHHAVRSAGMGFCIFNNGVIAIEHLRATTEVRRIAVVDWDVHHGNGTQAAFYSDPDVLTISLHQDRCFILDTGALDEIGTGQGRGTNINVPLPPGTGNDGYLLAIDEVVLPALDAFNPDLILVPSGLDASAMDPLGRQLLHSDSYRRMTARMIEAAKRLCGGRMVVIHEGGYQPALAPFCALAIVEELAGLRTAVVDPFLQGLQLMGGHEVTPQQRDVVGAAARIVHLLRRN